MSQIAGTSDERRGRMLICHQACSTGSQEQLPDFPSSSESRRVICEGVRAKSKTEAFSMIRDGVSDLGSGTALSWRQY